MGDDGASYKSIVPITAAVMAVGSAGFLFYHLSAKRLDERAYRKEQLSIQRDLLDCVSAAIKHVTIGPEGESAGKKKKK